MRRRRARRVAVVGGIEAQKVQQQQVGLMALDDVPYEEIAETIGITQNNVRVRMNRIREKLRKLMTA